MKGYFINHPTPQINKMKDYFFLPHPGQEKYLRKGFNVINRVNIVLYLYVKLFKLSLFFLFYLT